MHAHHKRAIGPGTQCEPCHHLYGESKELPPFLQMISGGPALKADQNTLLRIFWWPTCGHTFLKIHLLHSRDVNEQRPSFHVSWLFFSTQQKVPLKKEPRGDFMGCFRRCSTAFSMTTYVLTMFENLSDVNQLSACSQNKRKHNLSNQG